MEDPKWAQEPFLSGLRWLIRIAVRILAVLMTLLIFAGVGDVAFEIWRRLMAPPRFLLTISDILATFGVFMAVLIAIEIFINISMYLRDDVIHVKLVMATAVMAIARKVIVIDFDIMTPWEVIAIGAVVLAASAGYWIVHLKYDDRPEEEEHF